MINKITQLVATPAFILTIIASTFAGFVFVIAHAWGMTNLGNVNIGFASMMLGVVPVVAVLTIIVVRYEDKVEMHGNVKFELGWDAGLADGIYATWDLVDHDEFPTPEDLLRHILSQIEI